MTESSSSPLPIANGHDPASPLLTPEQQAKKNARQRANYALNKEKHNAWNKERAAYKRDWYLANLKRIQAARSAPEARAKTNAAQNAKRRSDPAYVERELLTPEQQQAKKNARQRVYYAQNKEKFQAWNKNRAAAKREWALAHIESIRAAKSTPEARAKKNGARNEKYRTDPEYRALQRAKGSAQYARNPEKWIQRARAYYERTKPAQQEARKRYYQANKEDFIRRAREWHAKNPDKAKASAYASLERNRGRIKERQFSRFGLTYEEYLEILTEQHGVCAICKNPERMTVKKTGRVQYLCVDHNHSTGKTRGLLCGRCNIAIGMLGDEPATVFAAWEYLSKHKTEEK